MRRSIKLIFISKRVYKEVLLDEFEKEIKIGTDIESDIRFKQSDFFAPFLFIITPYENAVNLKCGKELYIKSSSGAQLCSCDLEIDNYVDVFFTDGEIRLFEIRCVANFDYLSTKFDRVIDIASMNEVKIGAKANSHIVLKDTIVGKDDLKLVKSGGKWSLHVFQVGCGTTINGARTRGAVLSDHDFFAIGPYIFCFNDGLLYTSSHFNTVYQGVRYTDVANNNMLGTLEYPWFNRSTRIKEQLCDEPIKILDPPVMPNEPNSNIILQVMPALVTLALVIVMRGFMGNSSASFVLFSACTMVVGVLTTIYGIISQRRKYNDEIAHRQLVYNNYLSDKQGEIEQFREEEVAKLQQQYISPKEEVQIINSFDSRLFEKMPRDDDFLEIYLGRGRRDAKRAISYKEKEEVEVKDELAKLPSEIAEKYKEIEDVPITIGLRNSSPVGIYGDRTSLYEILKVMTVDIATRHYYEEVQLLYILDSADVNQFRWIRYLPHIQNKELHCRNIVCDEESKNTHYEALFRNILSQEQSNKYTVVFVYRENGILQHPLAKLMEQAAQRGILFVHFSEYREQLPNNCRYLIQMNNNDTGSITCADDGDSTKGFVYESITDFALQNAIERLAPVQCKEIALESELTRNISLFELLNIYSPEDIPLKQQWGKSTVERSLAAPIGVRNNGETVVLDIHEKAHGPHGLVAGTTGSGKSQALQTYILSLALRYAPEDVEFILIDYKGGGMANQFKRLPHLVGTITDIDGKGIARSLKALQAEQKKREELFARYGSEDKPIDHIDKYIKLYKANKEMTPLPHLIIIADEFGELKTEQPEFMRELISIARKGRSLGIHLILATQKPSGLVDPQIWSNSRFKLCLKVQSREDSMEVLKTPVASEITNAGRAYLQVGNNEIFELFQTAFSGGAANIIGRTQQKEFSISAVSFAGRRTLVYQRKNRKDNEEIISQQQSVIAYIADYCKKAKIQPLPQICIPALETIIYRNNMDRCKDISNGLTVEIGIFDDPAHQLQDVQILNITQENTLIIGSSQYGKTSLIQTMLCDLVERYSPKQVNIYILDFGTMIFRNYDNLPHVGGVVCANDDEKLKNLFRLLNIEMTVRKEKLLSAGVSSYAAYLEAGFEDIPQIVLMIDNLTGFRELYLNDNDILLPVCRDGSSLGISVIIANSQITGVASSYRYLPNLPQRIAFTCNETAEYTVLFNTARTIPSAFPGRCLMMREKELCEVQCYLPFGGEREYERVGQIHIFVDRIQQEYGNQRAKRIPEVPAVLNKVTLKDSFGVENDENSVYIGVDYDTMNPVAMQWGAQNVLMISGRNEKGKSEFLSYLVQELASHRGRLLVIDDGDGKLSYTENLPATELYTRSVTDINELLRRIEQYMDQRYQDKMTGGLSLKALSPIVLLIQNRNMMETVDGDKGMTSILERFANKYIGLKGVIIFADYENEAISYKSPAALKAMQKAMNYLLFEECDKIKVTNVTSEERKRYARPLSSGEAYFSNGDRLMKIKVVK